MSAQGKTIFTRSSGWNERYQVMFTESGDWRGQHDRSYEKKASAIARAEELTYERGIGRVWVVDTKAGVE